MIEMLLKFSAFLTARDRTKWYSFSTFDMCLFLISGVSYLVSDFKNNPAIMWIVIIIMNAVESFYYNKNNKD